ncbi:MAG: hypothetical protein Q8R83_03870 [Legionellaceae bacterium]|nr:hypothetical protein [Legionellaceae bacterium]
MKKTKIGDASELTITFAELTDLVKTLEEKNINLEDWTSAMQLFINKSKDYVSNIKYNSFLFFGLSRSFPDLVLKVIGKFERGFPHPIYINKLEVKPDETVVVTGPHNIIHLIEANISKALESLHPSVRQASLNN